MSYPWHSQVDVPESAQAIFQHSDTFRQQISSLDLICSIYNKIQRTILPVEKPLVLKQLQDVEQALARGMQELNWKVCNGDLAVHVGRMDELWRRARGATFPARPSNSMPMPPPPICSHWDVDCTSVYPCAQSDTIDAYIKECMDMVKDVDLTLTTIKDNVKATQVGRLSAPCVVLQLPAFFLSCKDSAVG